MRNHYSMLEQKKNQTPCRCIPVYKAYFHLLVVCLLVAGQIQTLRHAIIAKTYKSDWKINKTIPV